MPVHETGSRAEKSPVRTATSATSKVAASSSGRLSLTAPPALLFCRWPFLVTEFVACRWADMVVILEPPEQSGKSTAMLVRACEETLLETSRQLTANETEDSRGHCCCAYSSQLHGTLL